MLKDSLNKLFVNSSRVHLAEFARQAALSLPPGSRVLDAGAGQCPYRPFFDQMIYESSDFCQVDNLPYGPIDYVCDITSIPVEDNRFDLVLCTQVICELPDPEAALKELCRVLKPGKMLWVTAPVYYPQIPIPYDYYRFAENGLRLLLEKSGFVVDEVNWLEGYLGTVGFELKSIAAQLPTRPAEHGGGLAGLLGALLSVLLKPAFFLLASVYSQLDVRHKHTRTGFAKNYTAVACKPQNPAV